MKCCECIDFLDDYLAGGLPAEVRATFERHLKACPDCEVYLDTYRGTIFLAKSAAGPMPEPADLPEGLIQAILASRPN